MKVEALFLAVLFSFCPVLAENQLRFLARAPGVVDVHLANSDTVAAAQLFVHLEGIAVFTGADFADRTDGSTWQLAFNVLGSHDIRILLFSPRGSVLPPGGGAVVRIYFESDATSYADSSTLSFDTAILASRDAHTLDVDAIPLTFKEQGMPEKPNVELNNYPNPFNPFTTISFELKQGGDVDLSVYDLRGRRITQLKSGHMEAGRYDVQWSATDDQGTAVSSGFYICRLLADGASTTKKMILAK